MRITTLFALQCRGCQVDTFVIFQNEKESAEFLIRLNGIHSSLQFTFEKEKNNSLPFLDVHDEHTKGSYETKVYRKPTFTGQYLRRESFTPIQRKVNLVSTLVHLTFKICSKSKLKEEINRIKEILLDNGYPEDFVLKQISKKITQFSRPKRFGPDKCPVYIGCSEKKFFWNFKKVVSSFVANGPKMTLKLVFGCCPPDGLATGPNPPLNIKLP